MKYTLRLTEAQHMTLRQHLFPGDGLEAVAWILCGRRNGEIRHVFTAHKVILVPHEICRRGGDQVTWPTDVLDPLIAEAYWKGQALVKVHSHTAYYRSFSTTDDQSDRSLFTSVSSLLDDGLPHASAIMLPGGEMFGRVVGESGIIDELFMVTVVGDDLKVWAQPSTSYPETFTQRHAQAFGSATTSLLRSLSVAVIGCSGTGSIVIEQLARLGIGRFVLVDPDRVEERNLNRILNCGKEDAYLQRPKVHALATAIAKMGFEQEVEPFMCNLIQKEVVLAVAECDVVFGCMDGVEGRHLLNRLATFYCMPYFDVGVKLDADGQGGITNIMGAVHYLQPGRSSLHSRGVYTMKEVEAESMRRMNPELYESQKKEGYIRGIQEDRPAVISVNMFFAALVVNDFLARLHPYRNQPNGGSNQFDFHWDKPYPPDCPGTTGWFQMAVPGDTTGTRVRCAHKVGQPNVPLSEGISGPPTQQQVQDYLNSLPPTDPLAPEQNVEKGGTTGSTTPAQQTTTQSVTTNEIHTEVVNNTTITGGDVVVKSNEPPPAGTTTTTTKEQGATTTTTTMTNPDGSETKHEEQQVSTSCAAGSHDSRTFQSVWEMHKATWSNSTLLSYLTLMQNLTWPTTLPNIALTSTMFGTQHVDFNDWAWLFTALRTLIIFGATLTAYRLVFAGRA